MSEQKKVNYPQMPPLTGEEIEEFLHQPRIARLGTHNDDGTIHLVPTLFKYADGDILLGTQSISRKVRNIERNPNVTFLVDSTDPPPKAVIVYGKAELDYNDVIKKRALVFEHNGYTKEKAIQTAENLSKRFKPVIIHIKPEKVVTFDYAKAALA